MIEYNKKTKRVKQYLFTLSLYDFEGEFTKAIAFLQGELADLESMYKTKAKQIRESNYRGGAYADGSREKEVTFDKFLIEDRRSQEGDKELQVWGERDIFAEEMEALDQEEKRLKMAEDERKRHQYEALKKEFGA